MKRKSKGGEEQRRYIKMSEKLTTTPTVLYSKKHPVTKLKILLLWGQAKDDVFQKPNTTFSSLSPVTLRFWSHVEIVAAVATCFDPTAKTIGLQLHLWLYNFVVAIVATIVCLCQVKSLNSKSNFSLFSKSKLHKSYLISCIPFGAFQPWWRNEKMDDGQSQNKAGLLSSWQQTVILNVVRSCLENAKIQSNVSVVLNWIAYWINIIPLYSSIILLL